MMSCSGQALAGPRDVRYAPQAAWIVPPPAATETAPPEGAPIKIGYYDFQTRASSKGVESYTAYRLKILKPEALGVGNITIAWNPEAGDISVHTLRIIRSGQTIDVLKGTRFRVIQQEANLDVAMLSGILTAVLQVPGLAVNDEIEFAMTVRQRDPTLGDRIFGATQLPVAGLSGAFRSRLSWPRALPLRWRGSSDLGPLAVENGYGGDNLVAVDLRDPPPPLLTEGAPPRLNIRRVVEYSDFADWADVAHHMLPLFERAAVLEPKSPLRAEIARLAAASDDPLTRAAAALRFVQDQVRYVYVGLDGGNYRPASIDETWARRFGDCKAKTALLLAILREMGISAEAVLVNSAGGDGLDQHLPSAGLFDHVLVRATIAGKAYWLDGTRLGDRELEALPEVAYRWVLPLRSGPVDLEKIAPVPARFPQFIEVTEIDASAGKDKPARTKVRQIVRGVEAFETRTRLAAMSAGDADRSLKSYWLQQANWIDADKVSWNFDDRHTVLTLALEGTGKLEWEGELPSGQTLDIPGAGFSPPSRLVRPKEQDQTAPWMTDFPRFRCWATTIRLPVARPGWSWGYSAKPVRRELGGVAYWRQAVLADGIMRTVMSRRTVTPEIGASAAMALNDAISGFDNKISRVEEQRGEAKVQTGQATLDLEKVDWVTAPTLCEAPDQARSN
ncbi:DUF3857 domain-containing transglutaminase family protein [Sphingobium sp. CR28]|uniref:DUF3857 domain-containing transglutaminase family protein n=1 Tax=Sphingobium sp. CR28 TaxID=3400272 RepID=UPI003FEE29AF